MTKKNRALRLVVSSIGIACGSCAAVAAQGDLDANFAEGGLFRLQTPAFFGLNTSAAYVDKDANGNLLFTGSARLNALTGRLRPEGMLDTTFGGLGYILAPPELRPTNVPPETTSGLSLLPRADGGALLVDTTFSPCVTGPSCAISGGGAGGTELRSMLPQGELDQAFGTNGTRRLFNAASQSVAGSQVVVGYPPAGLSVLSRTTGGIVPIAARITRVNALGANAGDIEVTCPGLGSLSLSAAMGRAPDGKLVVAKAFRLASGFRLCVLRLDAQGVVDPTFGTQGYTIDDSLLISTDRTDVFAVLVKRGGGVAVVLQKTFEFAAGVSSSVVVLHYTAAGVLDATRFDRGIDGPSALHAGKLTAVAMQDDDKILVAGYPAVMSGATPVGVDESRPVIGRLLDSGGNDLTFGAGTGQVSLVIGGRAFTPRHIRWATDFIHLAGAAKLGAAETQAGVVRLLSVSPPVVPPPATGGGGGGGCYVQSINKPDPMLALLALLAAMALGLRGRHRLK